MKSLKKTAPKYGWCGGNPNKKHASIKLGLALAALAFFNLAALCDNPVSSGDKQENQNKLDAPTVVVDPYERIDGFYKSNYLATNSEVLRFYHLKKDKTGELFVCFNQNVAPIPPSLSDITYTISGTIVTIIIPNVSRWTYDWDEVNSSLKNGKSSNGLLENNGTSPYVRDPSLTAFPACP